MELETARHIAARIWCDPEYQHIEMDGDLAEKIAVMLMDNANGKAWNARTQEECNCNSSRTSVSNPELCGACGKLIPPEEG